MCTPVDKWGGGGQNEPKMCGHPLWRASHIEDESTLKKTIFAKVRMKDFSNGYILSQDFIWHKCTLHEPKSGRKRNHLYDKYKDKNAAWIISAAIKSCKSILSFPSAFLCFPSVFFAKNFILAFWLLSCQEVIFSTNWYPTFCFSSYPTLCLS